jgi:dTDP-4-amino-4,6-dideoxygalactose transaminase
VERYLAASREAEWYSNFGPCWDLLSRRLAEAAGRPCIPVANATLGLVVAIAALRRRAPSDSSEALVPSFAFPASAQSAWWNGLAPVFVDVDRRHWHLDPDALERALEARKGRIAIVIALSSFGVPPPPQVRERWESVCRGAGVPLLVDSAAGYGAIADDGLPIGAQGDIEVVSFHALKPVSAGEGGAIFCRDRDLADEIVSLINFAYDDEHRVLRPDGLNAKLSEPAAAIALASLDELPIFLSTRRAIAQEVLDRLPDGFARQVGNERGTWQFIQVCAPSAEVRKALRQEAERRRIGVRTYYDPLHSMPAFADCDQADDLAVTRELSSRTVSLPMASDLSPDQIDAIADLAHTASRLCALEA